MHNIMSHLLLAPQLSMCCQECGVCREPGSGASVEGWVADSRQRADRRALAFEEGEGEDEEANAHDAQDDHA